MRAYQTRAGGRHMARERGLNHISTLAVQHGGERAGEMASIRKNNADARGYGFQDQKTVEGSIPRQPIQFQEAREHPAS